MMYAILDLLAKGGLNHTMSYAIKLIIEIVYFLFTVR